MRRCECRAGKGSIRRVSPFVSARRVVRSARSAIRPRIFFKRVNYVSTWEISSARPNARNWTAFVTKTHTDLGKIIANCHKVTQRSRYFWNSLSSPRQYAYFPAPHGGEVA